MTRLRSSQVMAIEPSSARFSTIASDLVWFEIVIIEAVIVASAGVSGASGSRVLEWCKM